MKSFKILPGFFILLFFAFSCRNNENIADLNEFTGVFEGFIEYDFGELRIENPEGSVEVTEDGDSYIFTFSDEIPEISGLEFERKDNVIMNKDATEDFLIRLTPNTLQIIFSEGDEYWEAECLR